MCRVGSRARRGAGVGGRAAVAVGVLEQLGRSGALLGARLAAARGGLAGRARRAARRRARTQVPIRFTFVKPPTVGELDDRFPD